MSETLEGLNLKELIKYVRDELESIDAQRQEEGKEALLQLSEMELDLNFVVRSKDNLKGKFDLKILAFGAEDSVEREQVQRIRLNFKLADPSIKDNEVPFGARAHSSTSKKYKNQKIDPI